MTRKARIQFFILLAASSLVSFSAGVYATSQFIGNFIDIGTR